MSLCDFSVNASGPIPPSMVRKIARCVCGKTFTTLAMAPMRDCAACTALEAERQKARNAPFPPAERKLALLVKDRNAHYSEAVRHERRKEVEAAWAAIRVKPLRNTEHSGAQ